MNDYITVAGLVQFDPRTRTAGDKQVRDVVIRAIGSNKNFSITVWPEKADVPISKGDFLVVDGKHSQSVRQNKDGEQVTYNNMSATTLFRLAGQGAHGDCSYRYCCSRCYRG
jgi:hypothetical protein